MRGQMPIGSTIANNDERHPAAPEKLLTAEQSCDALLLQIAAIRGAINGLMGAVIEGYLVDYLMEPPALKQRQHEAAAVLQVIKSYLK